MSSFVERPRYLCALGGAMGTVTALPRTIPILHAAIGCAGNITWAQNGGSALQVGGYCGALHTPSSNVREREVVFGGEERLREQIGNTVKVMDGDLFFVLTGCVTEVIGDDVKAVVREFQEEGLPIVGVETGGFKGNSYYGYDLVLKGLFEQYVQRGLLRQRGRVNVLGIVPYMDVFWRGNLEGVRRLLESLGLEVHTFFTLEDSLENIRTAAAAELNVVVSDVYGVEAAQRFQEIHGTPFLVSSLPIGPTASTAFLRQVGQALGLEAGLVDRVVAKENHDYYELLSPLVDPYFDLDLQRYAIVVGDVNYSTAVTRFLIDDLGWLPELVVCTDQLDEAQKQAVASQVTRPEALVQPKVVFETDTSEVVRHFNRHWPRSHGDRYVHTFNPAIVIGSSLERDLASSLGAPHLSVSFPVANRAVIDRSYAGFRGGLRLTEDLLSVVIAAR